jgi:hypothetical protein
MAIIRTMSLDREFVRCRFEHVPDEELLRIAFASTDEYVPEAIALARDELRRRGIAAGADNAIDAVIAASSRSV